VEVLARDLRNASRVLQAVVIDDGSSDGASQVRQSSMMRLTYYQHTLGVLFLHRLGRGQRLGWQGLLL
jgi:hypothetical protein